MSFDVGDGLQKLLKSWEANIGEVTKMAVKSAEPIVVEALKAECGKHSMTGELMESIKAKGPVINDKGCYDIVRPTGKDSKGIRNMEKLAYLEYGTSKQPARPLMDRAKEAARPKVLEKMKDTLERELKP